jgi:hypothetical protein
MEHVASARERSGVGRVLLIASLEQHRADIEGQGGNKEERDCCASEQDEDLAALAVWVSC